MSTVGLVQVFVSSAGKAAHYFGAVSARSDDELRDELIPINQRWRVGETLDAAYDDYRTTGRRVSIGMR